MVRVGIVGAGNIGRIHARSYRETPGAELVAVCDLVPEKTAAFARDFGATAYGDLDRMLATERLDILSVTTAGPENGGHHYTPTMAALRTGVHVLCEKPLSNEIARAREMVAFARSRGLYLGVDLNHRFVPIAATARRWIDEGKLGEILFANMALWIRNPNESSPWFHLRALHPHSIDVLRYFVGDIQRVHAFMKKASHRAIWSNCSVNLQFASGAIGHLTGSYDMTTRHPIERCEVAGTKGRFVIENVAEKLTFYPHDSDEQIVIQNTLMSGTLIFETTFRNRIRRFVEQVAARVPPEEIEGSGAEGLAAQEVIEAAIRSWETGTVVDVPAAVTA
ncbi:MAG: Gfo/Idh/MocA family oxidoreductase [Chloroflexota bacterium]|nr:MAG: Gfo/Idh/MocA family oxidoreductase [Chloroflexota bacterium]